MTKTWISWELGSLEPGVTFTPWERANFTGFSIQARTVLTIASISKESNTAQEKGGGWEKGTPSNTSKHHGPQGLNGLSLVKLQFTENLLLKAFNNEKKN